GFARASCAISVLNRVLQPLSAAFAAATSSGVGPSISIQNLNSAMLRSLIMRWASIQVRGGGRCGASACRRAMAACLSAAWLREKASTTTAGGAALDDGLRPVGAVLLVSGISNKYDSSPGSSETNAIGLRT